MSLGPQREKLWPRTSVGPGIGLGHQRGTHRKLKLLQVLAWICDVLGSKPEPSPLRFWVHLSLGSLRQQTGAKDLCRTNSKPGTSAEWDADQNLQKWVKAGNLGQSRPETANSKGAEQSPGMLSYLQEHRVTNGVTRTVVLTVPWGTTIWALD